MKVARVKYFSFPIEDRCGQLAAIMVKLKDENVDMDGLWGFGVGRGRGQIIAVPKDPAAFHAAAKRAGWTIEEGSCFRISGVDRTGALVEPLRKISAAGINLHAVDCVAVDESFASYLWSEPQDVEQLGHILNV